MKHRGRTRPFRGPDGEILAGSIAEIGYIRLGGVDQWVMIRGERIENPLLVLVHGGPGFPEMRLFRTFNAALEKSFTVVYWEQRGTDKSFDPRISPLSMTVEQFISDLDELVKHLRGRFCNKSVALYGHSWGSALAVLYAARFPENVAVYVGTGQIGDWAASEVASYTFTIAEAERRHNGIALRQLRAIGPPPHTGRQVEVQRKWLGRFVGVVRGMPFRKLVHVMLGGPEASILDLPNLLNGMLFSTRAMWPEVSALDLAARVPALHMPVFFFLGRHDHVVDPATSVAYFEKLVAPSKKLVWFEQSAHEAPVEEPAKFNAAMAQLVRPLVT